MRILVVEDDPALRRQLSERLAGDGYAVDIAADGEEALRVARERPNLPVIGLTPVLDSVHEEVEVKVEDVLH